MAENLTIKKRIAFGLLAVFLSLAGFVAFAEIVLRFLPVNEGLRLLPVNEKNPVFRFTPNRTVTWSEGWNFGIRNKVHVNNDGFVNPLDYDPNARSPLLAILGDSYIEAGIVPRGQTAQERLGGMARNGRVYSFAASGAGLSQYLVWAEYARERYKPDAFVFVIIGNDFSESLLHREHSPGMHHFERLPDGKAALRRVDYEPSLVRRVLRRSALVMYLFTNVKIQRLFKVDVQKHLGGKDQRWVANIPAEAPEGVLRDYQWAVDRFLELLPEKTGVDYGKIAFVMDGFRPHMYDAKELEFALRDSVWKRMRDYVKDRAESMGITVIDMHPFFMERYTREQKRFEFPKDSHWNGEGHRAVADAIASSRMFRQWVGPTS